MSDDFTPHPQEPDEIGMLQIHGRLLDLGTEWRYRPLPSTVIDRLTTHVQKISTEGHHASDTRYSDQGDSLLGDTYPPPSSTPYPQRSIISAISAMLIIILLGTAFFLVIKRGVGTLPPTMTVTANVSVTASTVSPSATTPSAIANQYLSFHMVTTTSGWANSEDKIYRTTDAGHTWHDVTPTGATPVGSSAGRPAAFVMTALDATTAWFSDGRNIFRTVNGGQTWQSTATTASGIMTKLIFVDALHGWAKEYLGLNATQEFMTLWHTTDGGASWGRVASTDDVPSQGLQNDGHKQLLVFLNATTGWIGGVSGQNEIYLLVTHDGGVTWQPQPLPMPNPIATDFSATPISMAFFDALNGALSISITPAAGGPPIIYSYVTHDGGSSWLITGTEPSGSLGTTDFLDLNHWWALGESISDGVSHSQLAITSDGGQHWNTVDLGGGLIFQDDGPNSGSPLNLVSPTTGWIWLYGEYFLMTTDGGHTWQQIAYQVS